MFYLELNFRVYSTSDFSKLNLEFLKEILTKTESI